MREYSVNVRFFCQHLKRYIPQGTIIFRSDETTKLVLKDVEDSENTNNVIISDFEFTEPNDISWFDGIVDGPNVATFLTLVATTSETPSGGESSGGGDPNFSVVATNTNAGPSNVFGVSLNNANTFGSNNTIDTTSDYSSAFGYGNAINTGASKSSAFGYKNTILAGSYNSSAFGYHNSISADTKYSCAVGYNNYLSATVSSFYMSAVGSKNVVDTYGGSAFGCRNSTRAGRSQVSFGYHNRSYNDYACAMGVKNTTRGVKSSTVGHLNYTSALAQHSSAFGYRNRATSDTNISAFGNFNSAYALKSSAFGYKNTINLYCNFGSAFGYKNTISSGAYRASVFGYGNISDTNDGSAFGNLNEVHHNFASAFGCKNINSGTFANTFGYKNTITTTTPQANAFGSYNTVNTGATQSCAFGYGNTINATFVKASAFGYKNITAGNKTNCFGYSNNILSDYGNAFGSGNTSGLNANAFGVNNLAGVSATKGGFILNGNKSTAFGNGNSAKGDNTSAFGISCSALGIYSSAFGFGNTANQSYSCCFGTNNNSNSIKSSIFGVSNYISNNFDNSSCFGYANNVAAISANAFGYKAFARVTKTTNICGPIINRKDNGESSGIAFESFCGVAVVLASKEIDFTTIADQTIDIPSGAHFFVEQVAIECTQLDGTLTSQPFIHFGNNTGGNVYQASIITTTIDAAFKRQCYTGAGILNQIGATSLIGGITTGAILNSATVYKGRFLFQGMLIED